eukprot:CAMPEP_0171108168 /NCGR_PEP_ID=MMETSP0766_2-20121228/68339_1 /TAXON_ID=439317 /ORGANISM="Gambierdiscus australes, Strain CAWD 149" /LENGTH=33 /DNA_ID= /DNA_START= /DNA_END= /DNA_ORIENTATION=
MAQLAMNHHQRGSRALRDTAVACKKQHLPLKWL